MRWWSIRAPVMLSIQYFLYNESPAYPKVILFPNTIEHYSEKHMSKKSNCVLLILNLAG